MCTFIVLPLVVNRFDPLGGASHFPCWVTLCGRVHQAHIERGFFRIGQYPQWVINLSVSDSLLFVFELVKRLHTGNQIVVVLALSFGRWCDVKLTFTAFDIRDRESGRFILARRLVLGLHILTEDVHHIFLGDHIGKLTIQGRKLLHIIESLQHTALFHRAGWRVFQGDFGIEERAGERIIERHFQLFQRVVAKVIHHGVHLDQAVRNRRTGHKGHATVL